VIGTVGPTGPHAPKVWGKDDYRQQKEDSGYLEPDNAAHAAEGAQKAAHAARNAAAGLPDRLPGSPASNVGSCDRLCLRRAGCGLCAARQVLACNAARNAQSNAQGAAYSLRSHSVYDGSSDAG
jgi:hypothetical protein